MAAPPSDGGGLTSGGAPASNGSRGERRRRPSPWRTAAALASGGGPRERRWSSRAAALVTAFQSDHGPRRQSESSRIEFDKLALHFAARHPRCRHQRLKARSVHQAQPTCRSLDTLHPARRAFAARRRVRDGTRPPRAASSLFQSKPLKYLVLLLARRNDHGTGRIDPRLSTCRETARRGA
jgi:hypothetical protein